MSHNYTLDEDTYPTFLHDDGMEMDLLAFIQVTDPTKVKVRERKCAEEEARLLDSTIGRVVTLLPVAPARGESELEASVERLFDEGGSADQGYSTTGGGHEARTELVTGVRIIADENVVAERPKRPRKKRQAVTDSSGSSHPPKKLREDHGTSSGAATGDSSHHSSTNTAEAGIDSFVRFVAPPPVMTEAVITTNVASIPSASAPETGTKVISPVHASMFHDSDSTRKVIPDAAGSSHIPEKELSIGSQDINSETLHEVFVPQWNVSNDALLDDHNYNVGTACQACLNAEVRMRTEYCLSERRRLESECEKQANLLKARDAEVESLKAQLLLKETKAAEAAHLRAQKESFDGKVAELQSSVSAKDLELKDLNVAVSSLQSQKDGLMDQVHALETTCSGLRDQVSGYERLKEQIEEFQDAQMNIVNDKVAKLDADLLEMALHLEEKFYPRSPYHYIWLEEYLSALGAAISRAIDKGMMGCLPALNMVRQVGVWQILLPIIRLRKRIKLRPVEAPRGPLADAPGISDLHPDVEQLTLPIHRPEDQVVLGKASTSGSVPAAVVTTTALSTTFAAASSVPPITIEDYEIVGTDGSKDA
ncbi:hypothetical protein Tco_0848232 [Tanacetum coccineum]